MNDNIYGQGIDNHLMGLRYAAKEAGEPIPEIFTDEAYAIVNHFALSTSQVSDQGQFTGAKFVAFQLVNAWAYTKGGGGEGGKGALAFLF